MYTITKRAHTSADGTDNPEALVGPGMSNIEPWLAKYVYEILIQWGRVRYVNAMYTKWLCMYIYYVKECDETMYKNTNDDVSK